ncbi:MULTISPECIES: zf-HC2 domain-containing protein [unclassified Cupriavidus]|uniref:zf-HC2 domain-containing protein n=1 Tax=unclassified Cupriavidus TaxID=2640874 RepID=UPI0028B466B2|nr:zf-HC2 domain-containing protein [Cupriavidus sp. SZY C1]MDT6960774.1 zf-HC2 domain-containing protein [Cupriavidus sp. SZY C1]
MNCKEAMTLLEATADGEVGGADSVRLERHLEDCDTCLAALGQLQAVHTAVRRGATYYTAPAALRERITGMVGEG